ncbi:MAG: polyprenyl synthetase family protein, partial [Rubrobacter sp.]
MRERVERVFASLERLIEALPVPTSHRELIWVHLSAGREKALASPQLPAIQLPFLVHSAVTGDERPALPIAEACTLLYFGADLFDNIIDHELPSSWDVRHPAEANLAATTLIAAVPQLAVGRLQDQGTPLARLWTLAHLFAETLLTMGAGEHEDLLFTGRDDVEPEMCRLMTERKSGSEFALFAKAGAILATGDQDVVEKYGAFGLCFGTASQFRSDAQDIWAAETSTDLLNGRRTLPVVHALSSLQGEGRERLLGLLGDARGSGERHDEVRALLAEAGSLRYTALVLEAYRHRARKDLAAASPREPAGRDLRRLL